MGLMERRYDDWVQAHPDVFFNPSEKKGCADLQEKMNPSQFNCARSSNRF